MENELAIYALSAFAIVTSVGMICAAIIVTAMFYKDSEKTLNVLSEVFKHDILIRLITVFAVLGTATVLLFAGKLSEGALSLMSGIVGFVLGGMKSTDKSN